MIKVGETAPDFTLPANTGENITLSEVARANKSVVLIGFVLIFTGN